jgi:hypothetical protein
MIRSQASEYLLGSLAIFIEDVTKKTRGTAMVKCIGLTAAATKENGKMGFSMA